MKIGIGVAVGIVVAVLVLCGLGSLVIAAVGNSSDPEPSASWTTAPLDPSGSGKATASKSPGTTSDRGARKIPTYGDGQYEIGKDMPPGRYKTAGPEEGGFEYCYWERTKDTSGNFEAIIANENVDGQGYVTLKAGEYFKTKGCKPWVKG